MHCATVLVVHAYFHVSCAVVHCSEWGYQFNAMTVFFQPNLNHVTDQHPSIAVAIVSILFVATARKQSLSFLHPSSLLAQSHIFLLLFYFSNASLSYASITRIIWIEKKTIWWNFNSHNTDWLNGKTVCSVNTVHGTWLAWDVIVTTTIISPDKSITCNSIHLHWIEYSDEYASWNARK